MKFNVGLHIAQADFKRLEVGDVRLWHKADIAAELNHVRFWG
jgi:hypothetical protein